MKVFLTWSGEQSRLIAQALREFIPNVLQAVEVFMSEADIDKGTKWQTSLSAELDSSAMGIICLTPDNLSEPWILFEAGALSRKIESAESRVYTYLHNVSQSQIKFPLAMFQHTLAKKEATLILMNSIRKYTKVTNPTEQGLKTVFEALWPALEAKLNAVAGPQVGFVRDQDEMLQEVLELTREISKVQQEQRVARQKTRIPNAHGGFYTIDEATILVKLAEQALGSELNLLRNTLVNTGRHPPSGVGAIEMFGSKSVSDIIRENFEVKPPSVGE